jgi:predicted CXXCH cytochrome family protein
MGESLRDCSGSLLLVVLAGCSREAAAPPEPPSPHAPIVQVGERCLDCHEDHVRSYRETGMARALEPVLPSEVAGLESVTDAAGWSYRFDPDPRGARLVETWGTGAPAISAELAFAIGAGLMDRSYAAAVGERLAFAPLEVLGGAEGRHAALAPGHAIHAGLRFSTPITEECLACHTDQLPERGYPLDLRPDPATWSPSGISCAACHPGADQHVRWRQDDLSGVRRDGRDPIRTPSRAGQVESVSVCARCHLQGDASFLLEPGARGVLAAGGDLLAHRAVFVAAKTTSEIRFVSQVERLMMSRCYTESAENLREAMTCVTCHDPHRSSFDPAERAVVREACAQCHGETRRPCARSPEQRGDRGCVDCHMRQTGVFDVAEVRIHDHFIAKDPGPPSPPTPLRVHESEDGQLALFAWPGREPPAYADDPGLEMMAHLAVGRPDLAQASVIRPPGPASARLATYHHLRGSLLERMGEAEEARSAYERALVLDPGAAETSVNLGLLLGTLGKAREGIALLDTVIAAHPKASPALLNRAVLRYQLGDTAGCLADLEAAFRIAPDPAVANALAQSYAQIGNAEAATRWGRAAIALDPSLEQARRSGR